jgi:mitotic spindle assembly checkpoint protein MAD1
MKKREVSARLEVDDEDCGTVRINLLQDGRASLSPDWQVALEAKNIKVGDICAFHFKVCDGDLKLAIHTFHVLRYLVSLR